MLATVTNIIAAFTAFLLLFFAVFLTVHKKGKRLANLILSAFLFSNALFIIDFLLRQSPSLTFDDLLSVYYIGFSFGFLFGPLLYLYSRSLMYSDFILSKKDLLHFIPFLASLMLILFSFQFQPAEMRREMILEGTVLPSVIWLFITLAMNVQILFYMIFTILLLNKYSLRVKQYYSTIEKLNLSWLRIIVFAFFFMWSIDLLMFVLAKFGFYNPQLFHWGTFLSVSINFVFAAAIIYKSLEHPEHFNGIEKEGEKKYVKSTLSEQEKSEIVLKLQNYLQNEEVYLDPNLSLADLSSALKTNSKYVSQVINEKLDKNFFDLVNSYRINYAKNLIRKSEKENKTILEILYESGFNSKSVFNTVFKRFTGMTPTQFKKSA